MIDLTVVIPAFNAAKTIKSTLQSIVEQRMQPREIIVIDDGSTDNTVDVVKRFPQVQYVRQSNAGVSRARNNGVALSTSAWVAFCDADDIWHPAKLGICLKAIRQFPAAPFVFHDFYMFKDSEVIAQSGTFSGKTIFPIFKENGITIKDILKESKTLVPGGEECKDTKEVEVLYGNAFEGLIYGNFILPTTVLMRKDVFQRIGGFDPSFPVGEETEFFMRASKNMDFLFINVPLAGYQYNSGGLTANVPRLLTHGLRAFEKHCLEDPMARMRFEKNVNTAAAKRYSRMSYYYLSECKRSEAGRYAIDSLRYNLFERRAWFTLMLSVFPVPVIKELRRTKKWWTKKMYS
jgi:glycosyltransferase involved in cell wall biosynthesis